MERISSISQFEKAIKDFSKISVEIDSLINKDNAEAIRIKNKSIENRKEAIEDEASRRIVSLEMDRKESKTKTSSKTHDKLEERILKEVEVEFDNGVTEEKLLLQGNSDNDKEEEDAESADSGSEESTDDESSENESTGEDNTDEDSTVNENTEDTSEESTSEENTDGESSDKDSDDKSTKSVKSDQADDDDSTKK